MKRLFDMCCRNIVCSDFDEMLEVFKHTEEILHCKKCGEVMVIGYTKTPSVRLVGGDGAGYQNDGWLVTSSGKQEAVRRKNPS